MLTSEETTLTGKLVVEAPLGVEIAIADGALQTIESGTTRIEAQVPEGVYAVRTSAAGVTRQEIVRLHAGRTKVVTVRSPQIGGWLDRSRLAEPFDWLRKELRADRSGVALFATYDAEGRGSEATPKPQLRHGEGAPRDAWRRFEGFNSEYELAWQEVDPGVYTFDLPTPTSRALSQTIFVPSGRLVVVFLRYGRETVIERGETDTRLLSFRGVDLSRSVIVSMSTSDPQVDRLASDASLAEILLHILRTRPGPAQSDFLRALGDVTDDPYLHLYGAAAALAAEGAPLERLSAAVEKLSPDHPDTLAVAQSLADRLNDFGDWPDAQCLRARLRGDEAQFGETLLQHLPSLQICWRWAAAASARGSRSFLLSKRTEIEGRSADPSVNPWLAFNAHPSGEPHEGEQAGSRSLEEDLGQISKLLAAAIGGSAQRSPADAASRGVDLEGLTPGTESIVRAVLTAGAGVASDDTAIGHLAASLAIPAPSLEPALRRATKEVDDLFFRKLRKDPELWWSDPHRGRFGGLSGREGAALTLTSFEQQHGIDFLALHLLVEGSDVKGPVTFHLHPTFSPSVQRVFATEGAARLTCYALGVFTIGVTLATGVLLELNLAKLAELPDWFRRR